MRLRDHYDWVVLGVHPGALLSASLVARLGLSVLVLPMAPTFERVISSSGQFLDPEPNYVLGLGRAGDTEGLVLSSLNQVGLLPEEMNWIQEHQVHPQILTPKTRMNLEEIDQLSFEMNREYGAKQSQAMGLISALKQTESDFLKYWQNYPRQFTLTPDRKKTLSQPLTLASFRRKLMKAHRATDPSALVWLESYQRASHLANRIERQDLNETLAGLWYWMTSTSNEDPHLFDLLHLSNVSRTGASFKGGMVNYRLFLMELGKRLGVHVPAKTECRRIFVEKGKFAGVQITNRGSMISATAGILGCSLKYAQAKVNYTGTTWFWKKKTPPQPKGWRFTLALTVHKEAIPPGMLSRWVWQETGAPVLEVETVNPEDYQKTASDERILYVRTLMPYTTESLKPEYQRKVAARMMRQLIEVLPFLEFHLTRIYPDFRFGRENPNIETTFQELRDLYGFKTLDAIPNNLLIFEGKGLGNQTGIEGLFAASEESFPHLGSLGGTVAALQSVAWLSHQSGLFGPFP